MVCGVECVLCCVVCCVWCRVFVVLCGVWCAFEINFIDGVGMHGIQCGTMWDNVGQCGTNSNK